MAPSEADVLMMLVALPALLLPVLMTDMFLTVKLMAKMVTLLMLLMAKLMAKLRMLPTMPMITRLLPLVMICEHWCGCK